MEERGLYPRVPGEGRGGGGYEDSRGRLLKGCKNTRIKLPQLVQIGILDEL
jgi:hypothetical protein